MIGQSVQLLDRLAVERSRGGESGHRRQGWPCAGVKDHLVGGNLAHPAVPEAGLDGSRPGEASRADQERHPGAVEARLLAPDHLGDHGVPAFTDTDRVNPVERRAGFRSRTPSVRGRPPWRT